MIPDRYQYLVDLHNQRMFDQHRRARRKWIAIGLGLYGLFLLMIIVLFWVVS